jgi:hypothetical protein
VFASAHKCPPWVKIVITHEVTFEELEKIKSLLTDMKSSEKQGFFCPPVQVA